MPAANNPEKINSTKNPESVQWEELMENPETTPIAEVEALDSIEDEEAAEKERNLRHIEYVLDTLHYPMDYHFIAPYKHPEGFAVYMIDELGVDEEYAKNNFGNIVSKYRKDVFNEKDLDTQKANLRTIAEEVALHQTGAEITEEKKAELDAWADGAYQERMDATLKALKESEKPKPRRKTVGSRIASLAQKITRRKKN